MTKSLIQQTFGSFLLLSEQLIISSGLQNFQIPSTYFTRISKYSDMFLIVLLNSSYQYIQNDRLKSIQQIVLSESNSEPVHNKGRRYQQVSVLILLTFEGIQPNKTVNLVQAVWNFVMLPSTLVLVVTTTLLNSTFQRQSLEFLCSKFQSKNFMSQGKCHHFNKLLINSPALKILFQMSTNKAYLITNGKFYRPKIDLFTEFNEPSKLDTLKLHKKFLYYGNQNSIFLWFPYHQLLFYLESTTNNYVCDNIYKFRKYSLFNYAKHCWGKQMLVIELSKRHNISYSERKIDKDVFDTNYITLDVTHAPFPEWYGTGLHLQYFSGYCYHYCIDQTMSLSNSSNLRLDYKVWTGATSIEIWILIFLTWVISSILLSVKLKDVSLSFWENFELNIFIIYHLGTKTCQNIPKNGKLLIFLVFGSWIFWTHYEMELTSLVTVKNKLKAFESITELVENGYKMEHPGYCGNITDDYYCTNGVEPSDLERLVKRLAWIIESRWNFWYLSLCRIRAKKQFGSQIECFVVQEERNTFAKYMVAYTMNRYWILKTASHINEAGLLDKWNDWARYAEANLDRATFIEPKEVKSADIIDLSRLVPVISLCALIMLFALIAFVIENFNNNEPNFDFVFLP